jgi:[ribosomal protein S5]-alanine N-acetyltransferase
LLVEHWSKGYAFEAGVSVIRFAFDVLGASALFAGHHPDNTGSRRTLVKLGFRFTHDELYPPTGVMHPGYELRR